MGAFPLRDVMENCLPGSDTQERILIKGTASAWPPKALWATTGTDIKGSQDETKAQLNAQQEQLNAQQEQLNAQREQLNTTGTP
ncbi:hypothetical protein NDU88_000955 [Pleurodeles waltl]|uniref:Uncharacterized protein n=1 Tax=Pleurodeles waltl TaxID=8319 RepID=A0AAV7Q2M8_PLEWA|nr:hypothetical protein NDU88_000955 [Pleurodeles waltl]